MRQNVMRPVFMLVAGVAFVAFPAIAGAHAGNNDPNVVHACIGNASKVVRIVGVSGSCISTPAFLAETSSLSRFCQRRTGSSAYNRRSRST